MRRLGHISDLHFGRVDAAVVSGLTRDLHEFRPDLLAVTGDLTQRARPGQFAEARAFLEGLPFRRVVVPGNHDIAPVYKPLSRLLDPFENYRTSISRALDVSYADDEILVLGLSTVDPLRYKEGTVSRRQLAWLLSEARSHSGRFGVLLSHHPVVRAPSGPIERRARGSRRLHRVLERARIRLVLAGHLHESFNGPSSARIGDDADVLVVQASTATSTRLRRHKNAYNRISIAPPRVSVEVRVWDGERFTTELTTHYDI
jgi:3',5'-cyclic AMP phosphodiesterase CpdA